MRLADVSVVGVDADETLWPTNHLYAEAIGEFRKLLEPWVPSSELSRFLAIHQSAAPRYGFGALPLLRSMVEFAAEAAPDAGGAVYSRIAALVERIHLDPVEVFPWAASTLAEIREMGLRVVLITMGVQAEQIGKLDRSGLKRFLDGTVVVANKDAPTYRGILDGLRIEAEQFLMVGDSVSHDIAPVLHLGGCAALVAPEGLAAEEIPDGVPVIDRVSDVVVMLAEARTEAESAAVDAPEASQTSIDGDPVGSDDPQEADELEDPQPDSDASEAPANGSVVDASEAPDVSADEPGTAATEEDPGHADPATEEDAAGDHPALRDPASVVAATPDPDTDQRDTPDDVPDDEPQDDHPALRPHSPGDPDDTGDTDPQLDGTWVPAPGTDGMIAVAVTSGSPPIGALVEVTLPPAPNQPNVWPVEIVEIPQNGSPIGLIAVDGPPGRALHPGKWAASPDGAGYVVAVEAPLPLERDHHVVVIGDTASALMKVRATQTEGEVTLCWPVDADGTARPIPPRGPSGDQT